MRQNPLGRNTQYPHGYDAQLLFPIARSENRLKLGMTSVEIPFRGYDAWRAYEISWLDPRGKPVVAAGEFIIPCNSEYMVESKSLKLYLNSFNQTSVVDVDAVQEIIARDLSSMTRSSVIVHLYPLDQGNDFVICKPAGECLDRMDIECSVYLPDPNLIMVDRATHSDETLYSDLFRSNCPVTSQPDWGTVVVSYAGAAIDRKGLLQYLVSFRTHEGFHEDCAEKIFTDILKYADPQRLSVSMNFLRRGGVEINPVRTNVPLEMDFPSPRFLRQ
ncbi:MAG: NADPH-dependent 7-cyano-7-deazaguanine reductase QueF [Gammaproteobacteria bacterium]|nr:NADPH-dependent 7-cyano-7-deazaguanine reductase QueF [Gammaproteobacteria bacterium]MDP2349210.1 NADPH-dependent 7-cyano-7-deazaguanine reductase QueF [Gammaproteobacteria bacterium]